jgi:hypothetical protein
MSVSMAVRVEKQKGRSQRLSNFEDVFGQRKSLDRASKLAGTPSLFSFTHSIGEEDDWCLDALGLEKADIDAMDVDELDERLDEVRNRVGAWHALTDGLRTVDALIATCRTGGPTARPVENKLTELRALLIKAAKAGRRFRLVGE